LTQGAFFILGHSNKVFKHIPIIPDKTFTIGVIAAMPLMATTAKAATATAYLTKSIVLRRCRNDSVLD
jgi:hypothetical protein